MKNIYAFIVTLLITAVIANAQDGGWITHKGDNRISVKFPSEPKETTPGGFTAMDKDSIAYIFTIVDFVQVANIDSVALAPMKATPEFAAELKSGLNQSLPDVQFPDFTIGTWKGFTSYTSTGIDSKKRRYDMFMFIIGNKLYSVSTVSASNTSTTGRDNFVNSIMLSN
jgi:hypothetical protein